jgi:hypothetical protein
MIRLDKFEAADYVQLIAWIGSAEISVTFSPYVVINHHFYTVNFLLHLNQEHKLLIPSI